MPSFLDNQLAGKYKGISFLVRSEVENNVGQSRVKHTYPKTGVQYMEPMGEEPFSVTVELFFSGENYQDDYQRFKKAMQDPTPGRLFSPSFGVYESIVAEPASATADQKSLGEISLSVTFSETTERPSPTEANVSEQDVAEQAQVARDATLEQFQEDYPEPNTLNNILMASEDAKSLADAVKKITGKVREADNFIRKVDRQIRNVVGYAELLLNGGQPIGFLQSIATSFTGFSGFAVLKQIANIGGNLPDSMNDIRDGVIPTTSTVIPPVPGRGETDFTVSTWDSDTNERKDRNTIRLTVVNAFRVVGLIGMMESATTAVYNTTEEVDAVSTDIEEYYEGLVENDVTGVLIPGIKSVLERLKSLADLVLAQKRQQAYAVTEVTIHRPMSSFLLAYELYGELIQNEFQLDFLSGIIKGLNKQQVANRLNGVVKVIEIAR